MEEFPTKPAARKHAEAFGDFTLDTKRNDDVKALPINMGALPDDTRTAIEEVRRPTRAEHEFLETPEPEPDIIEPEPEVAEPEPAKATSGEVVDFQTREKLDTASEAEPETAEPEEPEPEVVDEAEPELPAIELNFEPVGLPDEISEAVLEQMQDMVDAFDEQDFVGTELSGIERENIARAHEQFAAAVADVQTAFFGEESSPREQYAAVAALNDAVPGYAAAMETLYPQPTEPLALTEDMREAESAEEIATEEPESELESEPESEVESDELSGGHIVEGAHGTSRYETGTPLRSVIEANPVTSALDSTPKESPATTEHEALERSWNDVEAISIRPKSTEPEAAEEKPKIGYASLLDEEPAPKASEKTATEHTKTPNDEEAVGRIVSRLGVSKLKISAEAPPTPANNNTPEVVRKIIPESVSGAESLDTMAKIEAASSDTELREAYLEAMDVLAAQATEKAAAVDSEVMRVLFDRFADDKSRLNAILDIGFKEDLNGGRFAEYTPQQKQQFKRDFQNLEKVYADIEHKAADTPVVEAGAEATGVSGEAYRSAAIARLDEIDTLLTASGKAVSPDLYQPVYRARLKKLVRPLRESLNADLKAEVASYSNDEKDAFDAQLEAINDLVEHILEKESPEAAAADAAATKERVEQWKEELTASSTETSPDAEEAARLKQLKTETLKDIEALEQTLEGARPGPGNTERVYDPQHRVAFKNEAKALRQYIETIYDTADIADVEATVKKKQQALHELYATITEREKEPVKKVVVESTVATPNPVNKNEAPKHSETKPTATAPTPTPIPKPAPAPEAAPAKATTEHEAINEAWDDTENQAASPERKRLFKSAGEIEATADPIMMKELETFGVSSSLWERGALGGLGRALKETRLDAFFKQSRNEKLKARIQELIELAGAEAPDQQGGKRTLEEYLPSLYQAAAENGAFKK